MADRMSTKAIGAKIVIKQDAGMCKSIFLVNRLHLDICTLYIYLYKGMGIF